jgi:hypothetical protein
VKRVFETKPEKISKKIKKYRQISYQFLNETEGI